MENGTHRVRSRIARWLRACADHVEGVTEFEITRNYTLTPEEAASALDAAQRRHDALAQH
jgi:hypothetical protein